MKEDLGYGPKINYEDPNIINHKKQFEEWLFKNCKDSKTSYLINKIEYDEIKDILKGHKTISDSNKKFAFKKKNYLLVDNVVSRNVDNIVKKVAYLEQFFELIYDVHSIKRCHQGILNFFIRIYYN